MEVKTGLGEAYINCIVAVSDARAVLSATANPIGVLTSVSEGFDAAIMQPLPDACGVATSGECSVKTTACIAGDWFTSDADGLAVKTETGFALGRILADPVDGLALCVVSPMTLVMT